MRKILVALVLALWVPTAAAEQVRLTFLHFNDIYQYRPVDGQGGLAELATRLDGERATVPNPVVTFGGDLLSPSLASGLTKGAHMIDFMNALGVQVAVPGNHEFDFGAANFAARIAQSRFPWVGSNIRGVAGIETFRLLDVGGVKVGFLGILTGQTVSLSEAEGVSFTDEIATAEATAASLRAAGAEIVVGLTHLGFAADRRLAASVKGIDLILGGHDHDPMSLQENGALILKAGQDAQWLGEVEMVVDRPDPGQPGTARAYPVGWRFLRVAGAVPSPALVPLVAAVDAVLGEALDRPVATLVAPLDSRSATVRGGEAAIGNLVADALRAHFKADVALLNGGGLRGKREYPAGAVLTRRDVLAEMPFGDSAVLLEITGEQLRAALEHGVSAVESLAGRFPQVSGLTVAFDPARPPGGRVIRLSVGGRTVEPKRTYRLATTGYLLKGGDGYDMLKAARVVVDASGGPLLANTVADNLAVQKTVSARVEGRVVPVR